MKIFKTILPLLFLSALGFSAAAQQATERTAEQEFEDYDRNFSQVEKVGKAVVKSLPTKPTKALPKTPKVNVAVKTPAPKISAPSPAIPTGTGLPGMKIWFEKQTGCAGAFATVAPASVFKSGDCVRARFRLNFEGYLTIVNYGSSGSFRQIFPQEKQDNKISPKSDYFIPDNQGWEFDAEAGDENLFFIVSSALLTADARAEIKSRRDAKTEGARESEVYDRDLKPRTEKNEVFILANETRLAKPLVFRLTLKHR